MKLLLIILLFSCSNLKLYKSRDFTGSNFKIKIPSEYKIYDKNRWDVYFSSVKTGNFVNVKILNINTADDKRCIGEIFKRLYILDGEFSERKNNNHNDLYGEFTVNYEKEENKRLMLISIINDGHYYYFISYFCKKLQLDENRKAFNKIIKSFKILKNNNIEMNEKTNYTKSFDFKLMGNDSTVLKVCENFYYDSIKEFEEFYSQQIDFLPVNIYDSDYNFILKSRIYQEMYSLNYDRIDFFAEYLMNIKNIQELNDAEFISYILKIFQNIPYKRPMELKYGNIHRKEIDYFTPFEVLYYNCGDCDSKSVLLLIVLKKLGYDTVILFSDEYNHVMTGVNIILEGDYISYKNKKYFFLETIKPYWDIGILPDQFKNISKWKVIPIY